MMKSHEVWKSCEIGKCELTRKHFLHVCQQALSVTAVHASWQRAAMWQRGSFRSQPRILFCTQVSPVRIYRTLESKEQSPLSHSLSLLSLKTSNPGTRVTTVLLSSKTRGGLLFKMNIYAETGHVVNRLVNLQVTRQDLPNYLKQANKQTKKTSKNFNNKAISKIYFLETYN